MPTKRSSRDAERRDTGIHWWFVHMVLQHIVFLQSDSSGTACFRNIVQDDVVLITVTTSAAYRLCYSGQRVQHWQQRT